jgi:hypothetical protein
MVMIKLKDLIKENIIEHLIDELKNKEIELISGIKIKISSLIDKENAIESLSETLNFSKLKEIISQILGEEWSFEKETNKFFIWIS